MIDLKYGKIDVPGAPDDEPCIVLRAQDVFAVGMLEVYYLFASHLPEIHGRIIRKTIDAFQDWPVKKIPDTLNKQVG